MKITCNKLLLIEAVSHAAKAVSQKSSIPALEGVLLTAEDNVLSITGYDLEMGVEAKIEADVAESGKIVLAARMFLEIVRKLPEEVVSITVDSKQNVTVKSGRFEMAIMGIDSSEFPVIPSVTSEKKLVLKQSILKDMIRQTSYAVSQVETRPVLTGALFDVKDNLLKLVAVDGYRLSMRNEEIENNCEQKEFSFVVPGKTLNEMNKILREDDSEIIMYVSEKHVMFEFDNIMMISRLKEGEFIDYNKSLVTESKIFVTINRMKFIDSVERASLLISEKIKTPIKFKFAFDTLKVHSESTLGNISDEIACTLSGDAIEIGFNGKYICEALKNCDEEEIILELSAPLSPMLIKPVESKKFVYLIVPMRYN